MASELREGDIEAIRSRRELEGKPIKSDLIRKGNEVIHYKTIDKGKVRVVSSNEE